MNEQKNSYLSHYKNISLIILSICICYSNTLDVGFFYDDVSNIIKNESIKDPDRFSDIFFGERPVGMLTFALNYRLGGHNAGGYHVFNILIHIINSLLIYCLLLKTLDFTDQKGKNSRTTERTALLAALMFAVHPIQTQAVTYIVQRTEILASTFILLALLTFIFSALSHGRSARVWGFGLTFTLYFLAFFTKEIAITLPAIILLYDFFFLAGFRLKAILPRLPVHITLFSMCTVFTFNKLMAFQETEGGSAGFVLKSISSKEYLLTQSHVIWTYLRLLLFPFNQNLDYDYPVSRSLFDLQNFLSAGALLAISAFGLILFKRSKNLRFTPAAAFFTLWFIIILAPTTSFIPILDVIYEHRLYLASLGFFTGISICMVSAIHKFRNEELSNSPTKAGRFFLLLIVSLFGAVTFARNSVWSDSIALWKDTVSKSPGKARPNNNLGDAYMKRGNYDEAIFWLNQSVKSDPLYMESHYNLGLCYIKKGEIFKALPYMEEVLKINRTLKTGHFGVTANEQLDLMAHANLGNIYNVKGEYSTAIEHFNAALMISPLNTSTLFNLAVTYKKDGNIPDAVKTFESILRIDNNDKEARRNLIELKRSPVRDP